MDAAGDDGINKEPKDMESMKELRAIKRIIKLRHQPGIYRRVLEIATESKIPVLNERQFLDYFSSAETEGRSEAVLVLKHDVDHTLKPLKKILEIENAFDVSSTFHVRCDEAKYSLEDAKNALTGCDVAMHQVKDPLIEKEKFSKYFDNVIGISTHGGHESDTVFNREFLEYISNDFSYISDGLLRPDPIEYLNKMLLIPIDTADIYFEDVIAKLKQAISTKSIMIYNSHVEYFMPMDFLFKELKRKFIR